MIAASMIFLICNAERSLGFATEAVEMCVTSLIPSLFPFMFFSTLLSSVLMGCHFRSFRILSKLCRIPSGSEILLILGSLGGYPVGAQMISNAYQNGQLKREDAQRMLGFCNNAGPAFIFGILGPAFESGIIPALLWLIQIISAVITGILLTGRCSDKISIQQQRKISVTTALEKSVRSIGLICGWVLLFKIVVGFVKQFTHAFLPEYMSVMLTGMLELTNGCLALYEIECIGARFVLSALLLSAGGLCVALQTATAVSPLHLRRYFVGKCIQTIISTMLALIAQSLIFSPESQIRIPNLQMILIAFSVFISIILIYYKKTVAFRDNLVYN